jgi:hypothetical protein
MKKLKLTFITCRNDVISEHSKEVLMDDFLDDEYVFEKVRDLVRNISVNSKIIKNN